MSKVTAIFTPEQLGRMGFGDIIAEYGVLLKHHVEETTMLYAKLEEARALAAQWQARLDDADTNLGYARDSFTNMMNDLEFAQAKLRGQKP